MTFGRGDRIVVALVTAAAAFAVLSGCGGPSIEELGRQSIRAKASTALERYEVAATRDPSDRESVEARLREIFALPPGGISWDAAGRPVVRIVIEDHLTKSGGLFGEQRSVRGCPEFRRSFAGPSMASVDCPAGVVGAVDEVVRLP